MSVVIIGAGQAGLSVAETLRKRQFSGRITMIGSETDLPYQRPPLSKDYLLGKLDRSQLYLRPKSFYFDNEIDLRLGQSVSRIDPESRTVIVENDKISYENLVLTTGASPRRLPSKIGGQSKGVYVVRSLSDIDEMESEFQPQRRLVIVGGGYVGLELAAVAKKIGLDVALIEASDRILSRVASTETSNFFRQLHIKMGVRLIEGTGVDKLIEHGGRVTGLTLSDGSELDADFVVAGIGVEPRIELATSINAKIDNGIATDQFGKTSVAGIWAAGDCASFPFQGNQIRLESVPNAIDHATTVARNILGDAAPYVPEPWFWSDQYDVKLQIAGLNTGFDDVVIRKAERSTSFWYYSKDNLVSVDAVNDPRSFMLARRMLKAGISPKKTLVSNPNANLKSLLV